MDWLSQNWLWMVALAGAYFIMSRMGMGCCGMGHSHGRDNHAGGRDGSSAPDGSHDHAVQSVAKLFDPVSQNLLAAETAVASVHQGHVYYFEDRANRDAFESDPEKYLAGAPPIGQKIDAAATPDKQLHHSHGCC